METLKVKIREKNDLLETIFLLVYACYYTYIFLNGTMIDPTWLVPIYRVCVLAAAALVVIKAFAAERADWKGWLLILLVLCGSSMYWLVRRDKAILIIGIFLAASKDVSFKKIVKVSLVLGVAIMVTAFACSKAGIVEDLTYYHNARKVYRHSFGMSYTTDFAAHILFLTAGIFCLRKGKMTWLQYALIAVAGLFAYFTTYARNSAICMGLLFGATLVYDRLCHEDSKIVDMTAAILQYASIVCAAVMIGMTVMYGRGWELLKKLDVSALSGRLRMGYQAYMDYGLTLWGSDIPQMGMGRTTKAQDFYFFLDSSYIMLLLEKGLIMFGIISVILFISLRICRWNAKYMVLVLAVIALHCVVENHLIDVSYNYFLFIPFAALDFAGTGRVQPQASADSGMPNVGRV